MEFQVYSQKNNFKNYIKKMKVHVKYILEDDLVYDCANTIR